MRNEILHHLARRIREIEADERSLVSKATPLATSALAEIFPDGALPAGALVELLSAAEGGGAWTLALLLAKQAYAERKILVVADGRRCFYPPAACKLGIDLRRTLVLRTPRPSSKRGKDRWEVTALVQSLRCPAVGAVISNFERLTPAEYRSLQLAAEAGGGVGFLMLPASALGAPSFAAVRLLVSAERGAPSAESETPSTALHSSRRIQVEVVRRRGGSGQSFLLEIDHETGHVRVLPSVAPATAAARPARTGR